MNSTNLNSTKSNLLITTKSTHAKFTKTERNWGAIKEQKDKRVRSSHHNLRNANNDNNDVQCRSKAPYFV